MTEKNLHYAKVTVPLEKVRLLRRGDKDRLLHNPGKYCSIKINTAVNSVSETV